MSNIKGIVPARCHISLLDLSNTSATQLPVFLCCVGRGSGLEFCFTDQHKKTEAQWGSKEDPRPHSCKWPWLTLNPKSDILESRYSFPIGLLFSLWNSGLVLFWFLQGKRRNDWLCLDLALFIVLFIYCYYFFLTFQYSHLFTQEMHREEYPPSHQHHTAV